MSAAHFRCSYSMASLQLHLFCLVRKEDNSLLSFMVSKIILFYPSYLLVTSFHNNKAQFF